MSLLGVDVSHWQGTIDWGRARAAGVQFAFAKATEDDNYTDPRFAANIAGMRSAGILAGAYHFLRPGNVAGQADLFCRTVPPDVIHALDVEASGLDPFGWVRRYRASYPDKTLLIYTGRDLWARSTDADGSGLGPLWVAGYIPNRYLAGGSLSAVASQIGSNRGGVPFAGWTTPLFLQFTDASTVPGIPALCDGDVFYGSRAELEALTTTTGGAPDMELTDTVKLATQDQVDAINSNGGTYKLGDTITVQRMLFWGGPGVERLYAKTRGLEAALKAQATQVATVLAAVQALAAGSAPEIEAAFAAGVADLKDQLAQIHLSVTVDSQ